MLDKGLKVSILLGMIMMNAGLAVAGVDAGKLCEAIKRAENSSSHPYGIMKKYKHTTPKQACINTVRHREQDWIKDGQEGDFIEYLQKSYAPIGASNDPQGLNRNWKKNVRAFFYGKV